MRLTTIVRGGQDRAAVVLDLPQGWESSTPLASSAPLATRADPYGPSPGHARYYLDVATARAALAAVRPRAPWALGLPGALTDGPASMGGPSGSTDLITVRSLLAGGTAALAAVRELCDAVRLLALAGDGAVVASALIPADRARVRTPVPDSPLYLVLHGNSPTLWRKQVTGDTARHITRVPVARVRTVNALLGDGEPLYLPAGARLSFGIEFGFVIGAAARHVPAERAYAHVAGYVCTNDCYSNVYSNLVRGRSVERILSSSMQTADKATDGCGPVGPWIATPDEVGDPHDLLLWVRQDGLLRNRAHSGAYLIGVEDAVARLSALCTLQPGTVVSLGAAGWDGLDDAPRSRESGRTLIEVEAERVGVLPTPVYYPDAAEQQARAGRSPFFFVGTVDGSSPLERLLADRDAAGDGPRALPGLLAPHSFWMLVGNQRGAVTLEIERFASPDFPAPVVYPAASLALSAHDAEPARGERLLELPANAGTIRVACQLAFVVGPEAAYAEIGQSAAGRIAGFAALLSVHDGGPLEHLELPTTDYERRFATFLGYCGDARHLLGRVTPAASAGEIPASSPVLLRVGDREYVASTQDYAHDATAALSLLSRALTLLPGDVIGLGPLGPAAELPAGELETGIAVEAHIEGLSPVRTRIRRRRPIDDEAPTATKDQKT